jgi:RND family efflux transporter MFP subunit
MRNLLIILALFIVGAQAKEIYATFTVHATKSANLAFSSSGIVDKVLVDIATEVKKDEILAKLQNEDLKASMGITQSALKYAKKDYNRRQKVKSIIDQAEFDKYASKYANAKAQLRYQQAILDKTVLKAPFDGIIFEKSIEVGDAVSGAMIRTVFKIQSKNRRKLVLEFDQKYWADVQVGDKFSYKVDGSDKAHEGVISKIYPAIDTQKRKVKAEVKAKDFIVGLFGDGMIITTKTK